MDPALSGRAAIPNRFEEREISELGKKSDKYQDGVEILFPKSWQVGLIGNYCAEEAERDENGDLQQRVNCQRQGAAADSSKWKFQNRLLWCFDDKLVAGGHQCSPRDGFRSGVPTGRAPMSWSRARKKAGSAP